MQKYKITKKEKKNCSVVGCEEMETKRRDHSLKCCSDKRGVRFSICSFLFPFSLFFLSFLSSCFFSAFSSSFIFSLESMHCLHSSLSSFISFNSLSHFLSLLEYKSDREASGEASALKEFETSSRNISHV